MMAFLTVNTFLAPDSRKSGFGREFPLVAPLIS